MIEGSQTGSSSHERHHRARKVRQVSALLVFYLVTGLQVAASTPALAALLHDQPGGVRQCARKLAGGKENRIARTWHRNFRAILEGAVEV